MEVPSSYSTMLNESQCENFMYNKTVFQKDFTVGAYQKQQNVEVQSVASDSQHVVVELSHVATTLRYYGDVYLRTMELQCNGATELACELNLLSSVARNGREVSCANVCIVLCQKVSSLTGQFVSVVCAALLLQIRVRSLLNAYTANQVGKHRTVLLIPC